MCAIRCIDLSTPMANGAHEPRPPEIYYMDHKEFGAKSAAGWGLKPEELHDGVGSQTEFIKVSTHSATHMDAPLHYGPTVAGKPARPIDQVPLDWCFADGVVLDLRHKRTGDYITVADVEACLKKIGYRIKAGDIVLLWTGTDEKRADPNYTELHPGMSIEATEYLLDRGVRIIGIDAFGYDRPFSFQIPEFKAGDRRALMPCHHILGRRREYLQIEQMANMGKIPKPHGFKIACFPVNVEKASGAWVRPVAIVDDGR
ncbi:MAG: cyclase family protein [Candidatus Tectomicrobia bacterium]|uniref:Cyclase family protein n=1 Tax=Tectimicrobiota bacterium TaxID=2528274 RepID=A0A932ZVL4_UNCTE|nr:cyclase family protein [Candidatus Tectomicrobia bacterium]